MNEVPAITVHCIYCNRPDRVTPYAYEFYGEVIQNEEIKQVFYACDDCLEQEPVSECEHQSIAFHNERRDH